jgi:Ca2+-binding RTX toxin-like protein
MATIYISPDGTTSGDGTSASSALPITSLNKAISLAGPGGTVVLLADEGPYNITGTLNLTHGGTTDFPVTIVGEDHYGNPENVVITGTRPAIYSPTNPSGNEIFKFLAGANNLVFENMTFENVGTAFRAAADISNIVINNMSAYNVQRFFADTAGGTATSATVSGLTIQNVDVHGFSKDVIELRYDTHDVTIQNVFGDSEHQDGDGYAMGIHLDGTVHNVLLDSCTMENAISSTTAYWNGDGFATETGVYGITFQDCVARGNADGGFDLKSSDTVLINPIADENAHNYRLWGTNVTLINPTGTDPEKYGGTGGQIQIQVMDGAIVTVHGGVFADSGSGTSVVVMHGGNSITFDGTEFVHADGTPLTVGTGIFGIDPASVFAVAATGPYSTDGVQLIQSLLAPPADPSPPPAIVDHAPDAIAVSGGTIPENSPAGTLVATVTGHDPDGDTLTYALSDDAQGRFVIDPSTGEIVVANGAVLDYETQPSYSVTVVTTDPSGLTFSQAVPINLTDVPESLPPQTLNGTNNADVLTASSDADYTVNGLAGDDQITTHGGNDVITGGAGNDVVSTGAGNDIIKFAGTGSGFDTVDGGDGNDVIQATVSGTVIGLHSIVGVEAISANGFSNVTIQGSSGSDTLDFSNVALDHIVSISAGAGDDFVIGSAGNDVIFGNAGADQLTGGGGSDTFVYSSIADSTVKAHDTITDFMPGTDKIDLSAIDADTHHRRDQAFTYIGTNAFSGHAGELRVDTSNGVTHVYGDTNGDKVADFEIDLVGSLHLQSSDFIL